MPKGKLKNPEWIKVTCLYCDKEFDYYRDSAAIRKACYDCIPDDKQHDASLKRRLVKEKAVRVKGNKCEICGETYPPGVYDFHHLDPAQKDFNIWNKHATVKWDIVEKEIEKCALLCANCHRLVHLGLAQIDEGNVIE